MSPHFCHQRHKGLDRTVQLNYSHTAACQSHMLVDGMRNLKGTWSWCFSRFFSPFPDTGVKTLVLSTATKSLSGRQQFYKAAEEDRWRKVSGGLGKAGVGAAGVAVPFLATLHYGWNLQTHLNRETPIPHLRTVPKHGTLRTIFNTSVATGNASYLGFKP